jgi:hypothetical protein
MGTVTATSGSTTVTGVNTKFHKQLVVGDNVVIRGSSFQVIAIDTATSMEISPPYRGDTAAGLRVNVTQNLRIPQSSWNLDRCDGSGPSGYNLDIGKMQMAYIDYTWYGAGFVRFGWRMTNGDVVYCHKIANNNVNNHSNSLGLAININAKTLRKHQATFPQRSRLEIHALAWPGLEMYVLVL